MYTCALVGEQWLEQVEMGKVFVPDRLYQERLLLDHGAQTLKPDTLFHINVTLQMVFSIQQYY